MYIKRILSSKFLATSVSYIFFSACSSGQIQSLDTDEFENQLIATKGEQLIDVRTFQEFEKYRIPSAKNIDFNKPGFRREIENLDKHKPVLIYCLSGVRSKSASAVFREAGFKIVYELDRGINAWSKAGKSIDQDLSGKGELSSSDYRHIISSEGYVLVDYYAPWCAPCRKMLPMAEDLAKTYPDQFKLLTVDFDQNRLLAKEQNITSVPYLIVFKDGKKIWENNGETSKDEIMKILNLE